VVGRRRGRDDPCRGEARDRMPCIVGPVGVGDPAGRQRRYPARMARDVPRHQRLVAGPDPQWSEVGYLMSAEVHLPHAAAGQVQHMLGLDVVHQGLVPVSAGVRRRSPSGTGAASSAWAAACISVIGRIPAGSPSLVVAGAGVLATAGPVARSGMVSAGAQAGRLLHWTGDHLGAFHPLARFNLVHSRRRPHATRRKDFSFLLGHLVRHSLCLRRDAGAESGRGGRGGAVRGG
jgi:hypothetical protein